MKIFTDTQIKELDQYTISNEPISSIDLMERVARSITDIIISKWTTQTPMVVFAGPGNNGGDALAVARLLAEKDYQVSVYLFNIHNHLSEDCGKNKERIIECNKVKEFTEITLNFDTPTLSADTIIIDGLFGTGLNKPLAGGFASLVKYINQTESTIVSIDIPSGLMTENNTYNVGSNIIKADLTLTLQQKKLSMMFADTQKYIGKLQVLDIRLSKEFIDKTSTTHYIMEETDVRKIMKCRSDFAHKGEMGHALSVAGCYGMAGASILTAKACMKSGVGKLTALIPKCNYGIMQTAIPEAIVKLDKDEAYFSDPVDTSHYDAVGIGPGLGQDEHTAIALIAQIRRVTCPIVIDADAINILANHKAWVQQLPPGIILTPHPREFDRLAGFSENGYERLKKAQEMAKKFKIYIILKGHHSALCLPDGKVIFNSTGNSGMATAGSGDVLTGIVTGLCARGYNQKEACMLGMYIHGLAADIAVKEIGKESLMAGDIIEYLPKAFIRLSN